jgi:hypothetical protein
VDKQPRKRKFESIRPLVVGIPSVAIGMCIVFMCTILTVAPHDFDQPLRAALTDFAVALPLFVLILVLLYMQSAVWQPYFLLLVAAAILWSGLRSVFGHLDAAAARAFTLATLAGLLILAVSIGEVVLQGRRQRRLLEARSSRTHTEEREHVAQ